MPTLRDVEELRHQRADELESMREITDTAEAENRDLSAEESQEYERREHEFDSLTSRIERIEREEGYGSGISRRDAAGEAEERGIGDDEEMHFDSFREWSAHHRGVLGQDDPEYRDQFYRWLATGEQPTKITQEMRVQSKATAGAGANLVPTSFAELIFAVEREFGVIEELANIIDTDAGETLQVPTVTAHGAAAWTAENAAYTASDETFGQASLSAYKAATIVLVSEELLQDSSLDLEAYLSNEIGARIGVLKNTAYVVGDGSGKPTGITTQTTAGKTGLTGQTTTVIADDLIDLYHSVKVPYRRNGVFVANDASLKVARKIKDTTNQYIWQPGITAGQPDTLLGRPIYADPDMPVMAANAKSILFGDFKRGYTVRRVRGYALQRLVERYADQGQIGFRAYQRVDGKLLNTEAVKHYANSAT